MDRTEHAAAHGKACIGAAQLSTPALEDLPAGWSLVERTGPLGFTTRARLRAPDGTVLEWTSRRHRKGLGLLPAALSRVRDRFPTAGRPAAMSIAQGLLFGIGSLCFALGSFPAYFQNLSTRTVGITFFVGSVFFTSAAYLQFHEAVGAPRGIGADAPRPGPIASLLGVEPHRLDWWATAVQFAGTIMFNISTFAAIDAGDDLTRLVRWVWAPDVAGSVCFLVASWLAYSEVNRGVLPRSDRSVGWRIAAVNMAGSIAFGVSAVAARYRGGQVADPALVNASTLAGALCFGLGALLLPLESALDSAPAPAGTADLPHLGPA
ncbi:MAG: YrhK family protein [Microthrixaceae bacterium]